MDFIPSNPTHSFFKSNRETVPAIANGCIRGSLLVPDDFLVLVVDLLWGLLSFSDFVVLLLHELVSPSPDVAFAVFNEHVVAWYELLTTEFHVSRGVLGKTEALERRATSNEVMLEREFDATDLFLHCLAVGDLRVVVLAELGVLDNPEFACVCADIGSANPVASRLVVLLLIARAKSLVNPNL